jgi:hypothetical protein
MTLFQYQLFIVDDENIVSVSCACAHAHFKRRDLITIQDVVVAPGAQVQVLFHVESFAVLLGTGVRAAVGGGGVAGAVGFVQQAVAFDGIT